MVLHIAFKFKIVIKNNLLFSILIAIFEIFRIKYLIRFG